MKNTTRVQPTNRFVQLVQFRRSGVVKLAATFALFALCGTWQETLGPGAGCTDASPIRQARADDTTPSAHAASTASTANAVSTPAATAGSSDQVKRGEYLTRAGDCVACHTADKTRPFAGGVAINTPLGSIVTPNITPDPDTGIGRWSDADFLRAMHEGIGKGGKRLYPAFPYAEYTKVSDEDVLAIRAYLNTLAPIHSAPLANTLKFPFNQRWLMVLWNFFNFNEGRFVPDPKQSAEWNRGAYLVEGLAHCEECHTPRNFTQGLKTDSRFSGTVQDGWHAYNITPDKNSGVGNWSDDALANYLSTGAVPGRSYAAGPMATVVSDSTQYLTREDLSAIAIYLRSVPPIGSAERQPRDQWGRPADDVTALRGVTFNAVNGAQLFIANCASCHSSTGQGVGASAPGAYPSLIHNSAVGASDANNLAMVILQGVNRTTKQADVLMPAFRRHLTDEQVTAITNYVTQRFGNGKTTVTTDQVAKLRTP